MDREGPYLPIDTKINFIGGSVRRVTKNDLVRRGLRMLIQSNLKSVLIFSYY